MKATNWIKSGNQKAKEREVLIKAAGHAAGSRGEASWPAHFTLYIRDQKTYEMIRVNMTPDEASWLIDHLQRQLQNTTK